MIKTTKRYAIYNKEGNRMYQFPTYEDLLTACHALERLQERYPDAGLYLNDIEVKRARFDECIKLEISFKPTSIIND